jgi:hypothetical protein
MDASFLPGAVGDDEGRANILDCPGRREAATGGHRLENFEDLQLL